MWKARRNNPLLPHFSLTQPQTFLNVLSQVAFRIRLRKSLKNHSCASHGVHQVPTLGLGFVSVNVDPRVCNINIVGDKGSLSVLRCWSWSLASFKRGKRKVSAWPRWRKEARALRDLGKSQGFIAFLFIFPGLLKFKAEVTFKISSLNPSFIANTECLWGLPPGQQQKRGQEGLPTNTILSIATRVSHRPYLNMRAGDYLSHWGSAQGICQHI